MNESPHPLHPDPEIAASLEFDPVPRRKRAGGWDAEAQRAFIAALAMTGSSGLAAKALRKKPYRIEEMRKREDAKSFSAAWERALEIFAAERTGTLRETLERLQRESSPPLDGEDAAFGSSGGRAAALHGVEGPSWTSAFAPLPVVCSKCAAEGVAGDEVFADIPYLLAFDPVPRPAHDRLWDPATQRAFVAALAVTGSVERAARSIKRHGFAVEKLRKARGAREFNEACEAALDVARQRELANMGGKLSELGSDADDGSLEAAQRAEYEAARERIQMRLMNCRRLYLWEICEDEAKRAAWEVLCGPTDWEKAGRPIRGYAASDAAGAFETGTANMRNPDMILPVENGWLGEMTGGEDKTAQLREAVEKEAQTEEFRPGTGRGTGEAGGGGPIPSSPERRGPRIYNLNSPEAYEALCPRDSRPWIANGALPREKRPDPGAPVQVSGGSEEEAQQAFNEWQAHVDAGRIGKKPNASKD